jgi:SNF2 family DNA or RNA helicase
MLPLYQRRRKTNRRTYIPVYPLRKALIQVHDVYSKTLESCCVDITEYPLFYIIDLGNEDSPEKKRKDQQIIEIAFPEQATYFCTREPMLNYADAELCGKWKVLEKLLSHWFKEGSKVLIFSYSVRLLKMLDYLMMQKSYTYASLDGSMDLDQRISISISN